MEIVTVTFCRVPVTLINPERRAAMRATLKGVDKRHGSPAGVYDNRTSDKFAFDVSYNGGLLRSRVGVAEIFVERFQPGIFQLFSDMQVAPGALTCWGTLLG